MLIQHFRLYFLLGQAILVSASAYAAANTANEYLRDRLLPPLAAVSRPTVVAVPRRLGPADGDLATIAKGNLFDPASRGPAIALANLGSLSSGGYSAQFSPRIPGGVIAIDDWTKQKTLPKLNPLTLKLRLVGTLLGPHKISGAVFEEGRDKEQKFYHTGDTLVPGRVQLVHVMKDAVVLRVGSSFGILPARFTAEDDSGTLVAANLPANARGVRKLDGTHWLIESRALHAAAANVAQLAMQARALPHQTNGHVDGLLLAGVQAGSLYQAIGLQAGDVIKSINGLSMSNPQNFLKALSVIPVSTTITIDLVRGGAPQTFNRKVP